MKPLILPEWISKWTQKKVFRHISNKMLEDFELSAEINHQGSKGTYRESSLEKFSFRRTFTVALQKLVLGKLLGQHIMCHGKSDLIIYDQLNGYSLIYDASTQVYPIECVAGTVAVKSTLNKTEFMSSLEKYKNQ